MAKGDKMKERLLEFIDVEIHVAQGKYIENTVGIFTNEQMVDIAQQTIRDAIIILQESLISKDINEKHT